MADEKTLRRRWLWLVLLVGALLLSACGSTGAEQVSAADTEVSREIGGPDGSQDGSDVADSDSSVEVDGVVETQDAEDDDEIDSEAEAGDPVAPEQSEDAQDAQNGDGTAEGDVPPASAAGNGIVGSTDSEADPSAPTTTRPAAPVEEPAPVTTVAPEDVEDLERAPVNELGIEPGSGTPDFEEALEEVSLDNPCGIFTEAELSSFVDGAARGAGVFDELPTGLNTDAGLGFGVQSQSQSSCDWFSDPYIWFVSITWEAADPTFVETVFAGLPTFGNDSFTAALLDDTAGQLVVGDLLVRVTNLVPGNTQMTSDRAVTEALISEVALRLG